MIIRWEGGLGMGRFGNGGAQTTETWETRMRKGHQKTKQKDYQRNLQILNLEWQPTWLPCSRNQGTTITAVSVQAAVEPGTRPTCCARAKEELKDSPGSSSNGSAPAIGETMRGACRPCQRTKRNLPWLHLFGFHWLFGVYLCVVHIYIYMQWWKLYEKPRINVKSVMVYSTQLKVNPSFILPGWLNEGCPGKSDFICPNGTSQWHEIGINIDQMGWHYWLH